VDRHVCHVSNKARASQNIPREALGVFLRALLDPAAGPAHEVDVVGVVGEVVARRAVVEMGVTDDAERLERLEAR
jgi:hypothetical protein